MLDWTIDRLPLHLKFNWNIARGGTNQKVNFHIKCKDNKGNVGWGEVAPNIRYNETPEKVLSEFGLLLNNDLPIVRNLEHLHTLFDRYKVQQSLRFGLELSYLRYQTHKSGSSLSHMLQLPYTDHCATAFTIPIMPLNKVEDFFLKHNLHRFPFVKVKIDHSDNALDTLRLVDNLTEQPLMIDANEAWRDPDQVIRFMEQIRHMNIEFVEQPLPASMDDAYYYLKAQSPFALMADESITYHPDFVKLKRQFDGVNVKLMKSGGLHHAVDILKSAKTLGMKTMIGCMVETGISISAAILLTSLTDYVDLDSFLYIDGEPTDWVKEENGTIFLKQ